MLIVIVGGKVKDTLPFESGLVLFTFVTVPAFFVKPQPETVLSITDV